MSPIDEAARALTDAQQDLLPLVGGLVSSLRTRFPLEDVQACVAFYGRFPQVLQVMCSTMESMVADHMDPLEFERKIRHPGPTLVEPE